MRTPVSKVISAGLPEQVAVCVDVVVQTEIARVVRMDVRHLGIFDLIKVDDLNLWVAIVDIQMTDNEVATRSCHQPPHGENNLFP
jgi:hypothetical protein